MIVKKNISKTFYIFIFLHLIIWTFVPSISNVNLPLDTIEALAWGSNLDWGYNKHPPLSAFATELFYRIFGSNDWAYYLLSQIFVIVAFIYIWKFAKEFFENKYFPLISILMLEGILFYNFTSPEFNVNISQLPFVALAVFYFWKGINNNKIFDWLLFGVFSAMGFLSKYLFIYLLIALFFYLIFDFKNNKKYLTNYFLSIILSLIILLPHLLWLLDNDFITIFYGISRSSLGESSLINHLINPLNFLLKQLFILLPFLIMAFSLLKKTKVKISLRNKKIIFIIFVSIVPFILVFLTSLFTGAKIRTMWMTPFYLFFGILFLEIFKINIEIKKIKRFFSVFIFFFTLSPLSYFLVSILDETKRTDYPGKEISRLVQEKWDNNFINEIKIVVGDEWSAGNLSYHLNSRPIWINDLKSKASELKEDQGVIYTGNPKVLKKICPGVFGTITPVGYCMIGKK